MRIKDALRNVVKRPSSSEKMDLSAPWTIPHRATATAEDIFYCFRLLLGRSPNPEEWTGHVGNAGADLDGVIRSYMSSLEFSRRAAALMGHRLSDKISLVRSKSFSIYVQEEDAAVGQHVKRGEYEPHVTAVFRERLRPGMQVVDIGANIGYFTMLSASLVGPSGGVLAVEPNPECVKLLEASRRENSFDNVDVIQAAAGQELGLLVLNRSYSNAMTSPTPSDVGALIASTTVPSVRLDDLIADTTKIDLVKVDVEGAEYNALFGMRATLERCHPAIVSEFSPDMMPGISGVNGRQYLGFFIELGYRISVIEHDGRLTPCGVDPEKVMDAYAKSGVDHIDILLD